MVARRCQIGDREIFRGRNLGEEFRDFFVQEAVVHGVEDFAVHDFFELLEIDDKAGAGIDFAFHRDFESVVVAVAVGVIAFAEDAAVLFRSEVRDCGSSARRRIRLCGLDRP